jgi:hypothetical protein
MLHISQHLYSTADQLAVFMQTKSLIQCSQQRANGSSLSQIILAPSLVHYSLYTQITFSPGVLFKGFPIKMYTLASCAIHLNLFQFYHTILG